MMASNDMDLAKIEQGVRLILEGVGEDPNREGLLETPARVARMYEECFAGLHQDPAVHFETLFDEHHDEMVIVHDISFFSMCEHHLVPFFGKAHIAYLPSESARSAVFPSWLAWLRCMLAVLKCRSALPRRLPILW